MNRQRLNPGGLGDLCDFNGVALLAVKSGADFQGDGHIHCLDHGIKNTRYMCGVAQ